MATEIKTWEIINGELNEVNSSLAENNRKEREDLEKWIKTNSKILGDDILVFGEQVWTKSGPLDYIGIDNTGNIVIVELKRDKLARDVLAQAGYFIALISNKLGQAKKDFLRQVIHYEYPRFYWEKDNFSIRTEYKELVKEIIEEKEEMPNAKPLGR
ncbi:MAG: hypothetical protein LBI42_08345 [Chitinispirillales bacterium]|jgi:hypothetical protein|nr:hypothetical protein [Chitinispirillales bacterium]